MGKWKVDTAKRGYVGGTSVLPNGTTFYGKSEGDSVIVDLDKPIKKDGKDYNVSSLIGIGSKNVNIEIKKAYLKRIVPTWAVIAGGIGLVSLGIYAFIQTKK